jgi:hypothetical protein
MLVRMRFGPIAALLFSLLARAALAETFPMEPFRDLIGANPEEAVELLGAPSEVGVHRGTLPSDDDVIWYYHPGFYLFFFESRVWQVRVDDRYSSTEIELEWGQPLSDLEGRLGRPLYRTDEELYYDVPASDPPLRLRVLGPDGVSDVYLYRADY